LLPFFRVAAPACGCPPAKPLRTVQVSPAVLPIVAAQPPARQLDSFPGREQWHHRRATVLAYTGSLGSGNESKTLFIIRYRDTACHPKSTGGNPVRHQRLAPGRTGGIAPPRQNFYAYGMQGCPPPRLQEVQACNPLGPVKCTGRARLEAIQGAAFPPNGHCMEAMARPSISLLTSLPAALASAEGLTPTWFQPSEKRKHHDPPGRGDQELPTPAADPG
jgi:hypothetical protein